jgi:hypothetical protein
MAPEQIAAAARSLQASLLDAIALRSDELADELGQRLGMVAWEREEQIGAAQRKLRSLELKSDRIVRAPTSCRVRELREQPLEALPVAWAALRTGRRVHVEAEADVCTGGLQILRELAELLGPGALTVSAAGRLEHDAASWPSIGVEPHHERVALVQADADRELAAYVLARACLRRSGFDPRVVHRVIVAGPAERLERNLRRLWLGARMGSVDDEHAFAGPVDEARAREFFAAEQAWRAHAEVTTICPGGRLDGVAGVFGQLLAPALLRASPTVLTDMPPLRGPILVIHPLGNEPDAPARAEALLEQIARPEQGRLRFGSKPRELKLRPLDRQLHGALLVERMPPGLPEPRP